jgi:hypothetical protein
MDFSFFLGSPSFSYGLKVFSWGSSMGLFLIFVLERTVMYFLGIFETFQRE